MPDSSESECWSSKIESRLSGFISFLKLTNLSLEGLSSGCTLSLNTFRHFLDAQKPSSSNLLAISVAIVETFCQLKGNPFSSIHTRCFSILSSIADPRTGRGPHPKLFFFYPSFTMIVQSVVIDSKYICNLFHIGQLACHIAIHLNIHVSFHFPYFLALNCKNKPSIILILYKAHSLCMRKIHLVCWVA